ncbi:MAG TPA: class I SAM-dependent methyltransferase [Xanthobacteraceae bacterium]|nr:class I SAM-dependent methyltransferase [Xanthobacteraceae bacterium]
MVEPVFKPPSEITKVFFRVRYRPWFWHGDFTSDWVWKNYSIWRRVLAPARDRPVRIVEIGSFEGRSAVFFLKYLPQSTMVCIDTFAGTAEENYVYRNMEQQMSAAEARFDRNVAPFAGRVEKIRSRSIPALERLAAQNRRFDLAYIDGGHRYDDVMSDSVAVWTMLEPGGTVIWDDYEWAPDFAPEERPKPAIDDFLGIREGSYRLLAKGYQVIVEKTR